ncbi:MAG: zinc ribbon domain-containing protein [Acidobacteria bacterium]|nr:zinc ribbon domain-containing protein [Acidobacteriota bacterium]
MTPITCPSCNAETSSEYNFCLNCDGQIKCLNPGCNKLLIAGKTFCFGCGQPLPSKSLDTQANRYVRKIDQKGRDYHEYTEFSVSDDAVRELAPFIVGQMNSRPPQRVVYQTRGNGSPGASHGSQDGGALQGHEAPQLPAKADEAPQSEQDHEGVTDEGKKEVKEQPREGALRYFIRDGDYLVAKQKDFKGKSWKFQQKHFILLYASAYPQFFEKPVPSKEHLKTAAQKSHVYDTNNFANYLNQTVRRELTEVSNGFAVTDDGEKEIKKIIALIEDEKAKAGYPYWDRSSAGPAKNSRLSKGERDTIKEWAKDKVHLGKLDVRDISSPRDYALVALWIITVHLKKAEAVRWNHAYYYYKEKYKAISATPNAFRKSLGRKINEKYFKKSGEEFYLTSDGRKQVEGWIAGKPIEKTADEGDEDE